jgi:hypothetical protein
LHATVSPALRSVSHADTVNQGFLASDVEEEENDTNEYPDSTSAQRMTIPNDENDTMIVLSPDMLGRDPVSENCDMSGEEKK